MEEFIQEILAIIKSDKSIRQKRELLQDYHESDIADVIEFLNEEEQELLFECYCCHYAKGNCHVCPVVWNGEDESNDVMCDNYNAIVAGEYAEFKEFIYGRDYPAAAQMARKIANLPERVTT